MVSDKEVKTIKKIKRVKRIKRIKKVDDIRFGNRRFMTPKEHKKPNPNIIIHHHHYNQTKRVEQKTSETLHKNLFIKKPIEKPEPIFIDRIVEKRVQIHYTKRADLSAEDLADVRKRDLESRERTREKKRLAELAELAEVEND